MKHIPIVLLLMVGVTNLPLFAQDSYSVTAKGLVTPSREQGKWDIVVQGIASGAPAFTDGSMFVVSIDSASYAVE